MAKPSGGIRDELDDVCLFLDGDIKPDSSYTKIKVNNLMHLRQFLVLRGFPLGEKRVK